MLKLANHEKLKLIAKVILIYLAVSIAIQLTTILQVKFQMVGDIIPQSIFWEITRKNFIVILVSTFIGIAGWVIYSKKRYKTVMALVGFTVIWQEIYLSLA